MLPRIWKYIVLKPELQLVSVEDLSQDGANKHKHEDSRDGMLFHSKESGDMRFYILTKSDEPSYGSRHNHRRQVT